MWNRCMSRTRPITLALSLIGTMVSLAQDQNYADCVAKSQSSWGRPCDKCEAYTESYKRD